MEKPWIDLIGKEAKIMLVLSSELREENQINYVSDCREGYTDCLQCCTAEPVDFHSEEE
jgi:hypothetical protein